METLKKYMHNFVNIALVILTLIILVNTFSILKLSKELDAVFEKEQESSKPANIEISVLAPACKECVKLDDKLAALKSGNVQVEKESFTTDEEIADSVAKYGIKRLPAIVVSGEINKLSLAGYRGVEHVLVYEAENAPYVDAVTKKVRGLVSSTIISEASCSDCANLSFVVDNLEEAGVTFSEKKYLKLNEAREILSKYNINKLPALLFSSDFAEYSQLVQNWDRLGHVAEDGTFVLDLPSPPYYDISKHQVVGLVTMTGLVDATCEECYDVTEIHVTILERFGLALKDKKVVDVSSSEGKQLLEKYNITSVPTVILSKEAAEYRSLAEAWGDVGSRESDGSFVFRDNDLLGLVYKDLVSGKIVKPEIANQ